MPLLDILVIVSEGNNWFSESFRSSLEGLLLTLGMPFDTKLAPSDPFALVTERGSAAGETLSGLHSRKAVCFGTEATAKPCQNLGYTSRRKLDDIFGTGSPVFCANNGHALNAVKFLGGGVAGEGCNVAVTQYWSAYSYSRETTCQCVDSTGTEPTKEVGLTCVPPDVDRMSELVGMGSIKCGAHEALSKFEIGSCGYNSPSGQPMLRWEWHCVPAYGPESDELTTTCISGDYAGNLFTQDAAGLACPENQVPRQLASVCACACTLRLHPSPAPAPCTLHPVLLPTPGRPPLKLPLLLTRCSRSSPQPSAPLEAAAPQTACSSATAASTSGRSSTPRAASSGTRSAKVRAGWTLPRTWAG